MEQERIKSRTLSEKTLFIRVQDAEARDQQRLAFVRGTTKEDTDNEPKFRWRCASAGIKNGTGVFIDVQKGTADIAKSTYFRYSNRETD